MEEAVGGDSRGRKEDNIDPVVTCAEAIAERLHAALKGSDELVN